jgi:hypothetical protein
MSRIKKLTEKQIAKFPQYVERYLAYGLRTKPFDLKEAKPIVDNFYTHILKKKPVPIVIMRNPIETWLAVCGLSCSDVWNQVGHQVSHRVENQVRNQVRNQVENQVRNQVENQMRNQVENFVWPYCDGAFWSNYFSFYDYFNQEVGIDLKCQDYFYWRDTINLGLIYPLDEACVLCQHPQKIRMADGRLHYDGGYSVEYDGWGIYSWRGVSMPEKYGSVRSENWKAEWILKEKNAELRRYLIQGIGYEKMLRDLRAEKLDAWREYELHKIKNVDVEPVVIVTMTCPSTGLKHSHRVPPNMVEARKAIAWCNWEIDAEEFVAER